MFTCLGKASVTEKRFGVVRLLDCITEVKVRNDQFFCNGKVLKQ